MLNYLFGEVNIYILLFGSLVVITYSSLGGIKSVSFTDMIQFFSFGVVIPMMVFLIWKEISSVDEISNILITNPLFDYKAGPLSWTPPYPNRVQVGATAGCFHKNGSVHIGIGGKVYKEHRLIYLFHKGWLPEKIDHKDNNHSNNKIENLREANQSQNSLNRVIHKNNKSGCKNVHWQKNMNKWCVIMSINSKRNIVGYFEDLELANLIAIEYRAKYHGEFARS